MRLQRACWVGTTQRMKVLPSHTVGYYVFCTGEELLLLGFFAYEMFARLCRCEHINRGLIEAMSSKY